MIPFDARTPRENIFGDDCVREDRNVAMDMDGFFWVLFRAGWDFLFLF